MTLVDGKVTREINVLAKELGVSEWDAKMIMNGTTLIGKTDSQTMLTHIKLVCLCGLANSLHCVTHR